MKSIFVGCMVVACLLACGGNETSTGATSSTGAGATGGEGGTASSSSGTNVVCGNDVVEGAEGCDDGGESAKCNADCTKAKCGDGKVNLAAGEGCDDGNDEQGDACSSECEVTPFVIAGPDIVEPDNVRAGYASELAVVAQEGEAGGRFVVINAHTPKENGNFKWLKTFVEYRGYASSGSEEIPLTQLSTSDGAWQMSAAVNEQGRILVSWTSANDGLRMHPIDEAGLPVGKNDQPVGNKDVLHSSSTVAVAAVEDGSFCMLWKQQAEGSLTNALRCVNETGTGFLAPVSTFGEVAVYHERRPALVAAGGDVVAVWPDIKAVPGQTWGQGWSTKGESLSNLFPVAQVRATSIVAARRLGTGFLVAYSHFPEGIVGQLYSSPLSSPTSFSPAPGGPDDAHVSAVVTTSDARILTLWQKDDDGPALSLDVLTAEGQPVKSFSDVSLSASLSKANKYHPRAALNAAGDLMVVWWDLSTPNDKMLLKGVIHPRLLDQLAD